MKTRRAKNEIKTHDAPVNIIITRLSFFITFWLVWSRIIKPIAPIPNIKLDASPSMIYCPFIFHCINATFVNSKDEIEKNVIIFLINFGIIKNTHWFRSSKCVGCLSYRWGFNNNIVNYSTSY